MEFRSQYKFSEYSATWPSEFSAEAARLRVLLREELVAVHHIGSTSVPGLAGKATIDLLPEVLTVEYLDAAGGAILQQAAYRSWGEYGLSGRRLFTKDRDNVRTHNLHFYRHLDPDIERHLAFCGYLRAHEKVRDDYAALKRALYAQHPADITAYSAGKDAWIKPYERLAIEWYRREGKTPDTSQ
jgi:GrpB-like predicted nucleotidyltransferase (UPF0157 family)